MSNFEEFCGSEFFNSSLLFNQTVPQLTPCLRNTVIYWVPLAIYILWLPFWIRMLNTRKIQPQNLGWSVLSLMKLLTTGLITITCITSAIFAAVKHQTSSPAFILLWFLLAAAFISNLYLIMLEKKKGLYSSMVLFCWYLCLVIASVPNVIWYSAHNLHEQNFEKSIFYVFFALLLIGFIWTLFAEPHPYDFDKKNTARSLCPGNYVTVLSKLCFFYCTKMLYIGYRRTLTIADLWRLSDREYSECLSDEFMNQWNLLLKRSSINLVDRKSSSTAIKIFEEAPTKTKKMSPAAFISTIRSVKRPRLWIALLRTSYGKNLAAALLKLIYDSLQFTAPLILRQIIRYVSDRSEPIWLGVFYAILLFGCQLLQFSILHQYFLKMMLIGQRWRTALIAVIYKKSTRLSSSARQQSTVGEMVNLMSVDAQKLMDVTSYLHIIWSGPFQIILAISLLFYTLDISIIAGVAILIACIPMNFVLSKKMKQYQIAQMKEKDTRIKLMNEVLNGMKVLKQYAWELPFADVVKDYRLRELIYIKKNAYLGVAMSLIWSLSPFIVSAVTFAVYVARGNILDAEKAFVSLTLFNLLRFPLNMFASVATSIIQANVSMKRIENFLLLEEVDPSAVAALDGEGKSVLIQDGSFKWNESNFQLLDINLEVAKKSLVCIVGEVGSGKSALFNAILGEMEKNSGRVAVNGRIAFVPQQAWILNATAQNNITIQEGPINRKKYNAVVQGCSLSPDFDILPDGEDTEIGEKGINLSGGQKQRISLARAVYTDADIYLMDDPLSAVDAHVAQSIFKKVIGPNGMLSNKTRIMSTNAMTFLPSADLIILLKNGKIAESGTYNELIAKNSQFTLFARDYLESVDDRSPGATPSRDSQDRDRTVSEMNVDDILDDLSLKGDDEEVIKANKRMKSKRSLHKLYQKLKRQGIRKKTKDDLRSKEISDRKLIKDEHIETGRTQLKHVKSYFKTYGRRALLFPLVFLCALGFNIGSNIWLSMWSDDSTIAPDKRPSNVYRAGIYALLGCAQGIVYFFSQIIIAYGGYRAGRLLHSQILDRLIHAPCIFFDRTPLGRIINRMSKDIDSIDTNLPASIRSCISMLIAIFTTIVVISISSPYFLIAVIPICIIFYFVQRFYIATSQQLRRIDSVSRSPIYSNFSETLLGIQSIRAYRIEDQFIRRNNKYNDENISVYYHTILVNRWLAVFLELLASIIVFSTSIMAVTQPTLTAGIAGLSISHAMSITQAFNWVVRMISEIETNIVAVERISEYAEMDIEPEWKIEETAPPPDWPQQGAVLFKDYTLRYREELDPALFDLDIKVNPGEKIGVVGRTGAGKSSLIVGLLRLTDKTEGVIEIDGIDISKLGLHQLRSRITVLPQDPVLFSGKIRFNLDPLNEASDEMLIEALKNAHLYDYITSLPNGLDSEVAEGGENFSVGQRQLICLARALLRRTKLLILDEATAAVDVETDSLIQATIRREFDQCTVITIAHRINTIMDYDRIIVLDGGRVKEFASPHELLAEENSIFASLARHANLKMASSPK